MKLGRRKLICLLVDLSLSFAVAAWNDLLPSLRRWWLVIDDVGSGHLHRKFSEVEGSHRTALCLAASHTDNHWTPGHSVKIKFTDFAASDFFANTGPPKELSVTQWYITQRVHAFTHAKPELSISSPHQGTGFSYPLNQNCK
ncbi:uncharacterized protein IAS62_001326 [Cryptococcus decagattii]|uniref:Secreted protein n=1 Tax=Cryptococcus decagattii TaxID=1859122 RepID=A0ABZ2ANB4_9TREE